jgi:hypothetical protein
VSRRRKRTVGIPLWAVVAVFLMVGLWAATEFARAAALAADAGCQP